MPHTQEQIVAQIEDVLRKHSREPSGDDASGGESIARIKATLDRLAPKGSAYIKNADAIITKHGANTSYIVPDLAGILRGLQQDYKAGYLETVEGLIRADLFSDFIDMAQHLLSEHYKDPAAVMIGSILEEHLRKLCTKNGINIVNGDGKTQKASWLNAELNRAEVISGLDHKSITSWLDLRNKAAHGNYDEYQKEQVEVMLQGVLNFLTRVPA